MAKPQKNKVSGGRVTPKGTRNPGKGIKDAADAAKNTGGGVKDALGDAMAEVDATTGAKGVVGDAADGAKEATDGANSAAGSGATGAAGAASAGAATVAGKKPTKRKVSGGRVTPKGTQNYTKKAPEGASHTNYQELPPSPTWVPVLMFALLIVGALIIMANYMGYIPPYNDVATVFNPETGFGSGTTNWYLLLGLGLILGGIITATKLR